MNEEEFKERNHSSLLPLIQLCCSVTHDRSRGGGEQGCRSVTYRPRVTMGKRINKYIPSHSHSIILTSHSILSCLTPHKLHYEVASLHTSVYSFKDRAKVVGKVMVKRPPLRSPQTSGLFCSFHHSTYESSFNWIRDHEASFHHILNCTWTLSVLSY